MSMYALRIVDDVDDGRLNAIPFRPVLVVGVGCGVCFGASTDGR